MKKENKKVNSEQNHKITIEEQINEIAKDDIREGMKHLKNGKKSK